MSVTLLTGLRIWDGDDLAPDADALRLANGGITDLGPTEDLRRLPHDQAIACDGLTALPGLCDAHVHLELDPNDKAPPTGRRSRDLLPEMAERALAMARAGITTARDLGGGAWRELALRDRINRGALPGPRLLCAGQPITSPGGHCHFWGGEAGTPEAAETVLLRQVRRRVDLIKVMATGGRMTRGSNPQQAQFDGPTLTRIVELAAAHDRHVAAHCHGTEGIRLAVEAGVHTIEHCSWVGPEGWGSDYRPEISANMAARGAWVSPTISRGWRRFLDQPDSATLARLQSAFADMRTQGVRMIASTDAGIPGVFHHHLGEALPVFAAIAGLTPAEALRAATSAAADALGLAAVTGHLAPGLSADIVLVDGDPLTDLGVLANPAAVWARGVAVRELA